MKPEATEAGSIGEIQSSSDTYLEAPSTGGLCADTAIGIHSSVSTLRSPWLVCVLSVWWNGVGLSPNDEPIVALVSSDVTHLGYAQRI